MITYCILHNIRSVHNVGSFFRTADASGVDKIYCTGYTPTPLDRFGNTRSDLAKVALGAEKRVSWEKHADINELVETLKGEGVSIAAVEQSVNSVEYEGMSRYKDKDIALVFGNEVDGVDESILRESDVIFEIPMSGEKESLNVAVTGGIILFKRRDC